MKVGLLCDITYLETRHTLSFFYAVKNIFEDVVLVNNSTSLRGVDFLIIADNIFGSHRQIWENTEFINTSNELGIDVVVFTMEKIFCDYYPHNWSIQKNLELFKKLHQSVIDVDDSLLLDKDIVRPLIPKHYSYLRKSVPKKDAICFIGQTSLPYYERRIEMINKISSKVKVDIMGRDVKSFDEYMSIMASYKYVLNPPSTHLNGFSGRLYETLLVKSIPLQHVYVNTLDFFPKERLCEDIIFFQNEEELFEKMQKFTDFESETCEWFEDEILDFLKRNLSIKI